MESCHLLAYPGHAGAWRGREPAGVEGYPLPHANASLHKCALPLFRSVGSGAINITQRKDCAWPLRRQRLSKTPAARRSEEHTSELQSLMRISYAVFCLKKKNIKQTYITYHPNHTYSILTNKNT